MSAQGRYAYREPLLARPTTLGLQDPRPSNLDGIGEALLIDGTGLVWSYVGDCCVIFRGH